MRCPFCGAPDTKVVDSRSTDGGLVIRRRRKCTSCGKRFTTFERFEQYPVAVIKRSGDKEPFRREKILAGLKKAFEKRPITTQEIEELVSEIESELRERGEKEVHSSIIGMLVLKKLKDIDEVAYLRFASVYKDFKDITEFQLELGQLLEKKERKEKEEEGI
ncbi:MAG: transcriptional regulator NrdR [Candidatus Geothermincolales bacterium]